MPLNPDAAALGFKQKDVAELQNRLERLRAAQRILPQLIKDGVDCEGREAECNESLERGQAILNILLTD